MLDVGEANACSTSESIKHRQRGNRYIQYASFATQSRSAEEEKHLWENMYRRQAADANGPQRNVRL